MVVLNVLAEPIVLFVNKIYIIYLDKHVKLVQQFLIVLNVFHLVTVYNVKQVSILRLEFALLV